MGWPHVYFVSPDPPYRVCNVIDPGDNRLDEGFGVILDFLDGRSFCVEQIGPKPQESAEESTAHFPSQMCVLGLKAKGATHYKLLLSLKIPYAPLPTTVPDVDQNEISFQPWLSSP